MAIYSDTLKTELALKLAKPEFSVLDIGCGAGRITVPLAGGCRSVVGIDTNADVVRGLPAGKGMVADAQALPFSDASFDLVFCYSTLVIVPDVERAISEIHRVLKPNGRAVIDINGCNANARHWREYYAARGMSFHGYSWRQANELIAGAGFSIERAIACGWSRSHLYLPVLRNYPQITRLMHSGRKPDVDHVLSNIWPLSRFASQWFFVVSKQLETRR